MGFLMKELILVLTMLLGAQAVWASEDSLASITKSSVSACENPMPVVQEVKSMAEEFKEGSDKQYGKKTCFDYRKKDSSKADSLQADYNSCGCLDNASSNKEKLNLCERLGPLTDTQNLMLKIKRNGLLLQSGLLSQPLMESYRLAKEESDTIFDKGGKELRPDVKQEIESKLMGSLLFDGEGMGNVSNDTALKAVHCLEKNMKFPTDIDPNLYNNDDESKFKEKQCISPREFLGFTAMPKSNEFYLLLNKAPSSNEDDWNLNKLRQRVISLREQKYPDAEVKELEEKVRFLQRNPLISNFMSAAPEDFNDKNKLVEKGRLAKIKKTENWDKLKDRKKELLGYLAILKPDGACGSIDNDCLAKVGNKKQQEYRKKMAEFFARPENIAVTNAVAEQSLLKDLVNPTYITNPESSPLPQSREGLQNILKITHGLKIDDCYGSNLSHSTQESCKNAFRKYCPMVFMARESFNKEPKQSKDQLEAAERRFTWVENYEPDIDKNERLKKLNDSICNTQRKLKDLSPKLKKFAENFGLGETADFFEFEKKYCKKSGSNICKPGHKQELVAFYLDLYGDSAKNGNVGEDNLAQAFKDYIKGNEAVSAVAKDDRERLAKRVTDDQRSISAKGAREAVTKELGKKKHFSFLDMDGNNISQFSSLADGLLPGNQAASSNGSPQDQNNIFNNDTFSNMLNPSSLGDSAMIDRSIAQVEKKHEEVKEEEKEIKRSIVEAKKEIEKVNSPAGKNEMENRISELEKKLEQKEKSLKEYQGLLDKLNDEKKKVAKKDSESAEDEVVAGSRTRKSSGVNGSHESFENNVQQEATNNDFKASSSSSFASTGGASSGTLPQRSVSSTKTNAAVRLNQALLEKYEIGLDANTTDGLVLLNQEKELPSKAVELLNQGAHNQDVLVDSTVYSGVRDLSRQQEVLSKHVINKIKGSDAVTMLSVKSEGKMDLQFYVIKIEGKTIVQPIRNARLNDLHNEMKLIQGQAR